MNDYKILFLFLILFFNFFIPVHASQLALESSSLADEMTIPIQYTCDGKNISPAMEWKNIPRQTKSFALILSDTDAPNGIFYHWVLYNIPATVNKLEEAIAKLPTGTQVGKNSWDTMQYKGPCPPSGSQHHYIFSLYALNILLNIPKNSNAETVLAAMQNHVLDVSEIKYLFGH